MKKLHAAALIALALSVPLAGCTTTSSTATTGSTSATVTTKIDAAVAEYAPEVARYCGVAAIAEAAAQAFVTNATVKTQLVYADITITRFCSAPPTNGEEAIAALADVAIKINQAVKAAKKEA